MLLLRAGCGVCSTIDKVDAMMNSINEQRDVANEISDAISNTANLNLDIDEVRYVEVKGNACRTR